MTEFPRKFPKHCGRCLAEWPGPPWCWRHGWRQGEVAAFRGTKRLQRNREIWCHRVGADHRLLFRLHPDTLEVVDLINRRDLQRWIKSLMGSHS